MLNLDLTLKLEEAEKLMGPRYRLPPDGLGIVVMVCGFLPGHAAMP
jgi:hypothetical protein